MSIIKIDGVSGVACEWTLVNVVFDRKSFVVWVGNKKNRQKDLFFLAASRLQ